MSREFAVGGEWDFTPAILQDSGFDHALSCQIVAPSGDACFPSKGKPSILDMFVVFRPLAQ
eukprot:6110041-Pyramimonas_sp.AAC.1